MIIFESIMKITSKELLTSLTSSKEFCTLCLKEVDEDALDTEDEVCLNMKMECFVRYSEMIATMLLQEEEDCTVTRKICRNCAQTTIVSYTFIEMCKESRKTLTNTVEMLSHCFFDDSIDEGKCVKSIYVAADIGNNKFTKFYNKITKVNIIQKPFQIFEQLKNNKSHSSKTAIKIKRIDKDDLDDDHNSDYDPGDFQTSCVMCSKTFLNNRMFKQHLIRVHAPKVYQCKKCPKSYSKAHYLNDHMNNSHVPAVCELCGKTFGGVYCLKRHMFTHKHLKCPKCGRVYENYMLYNQHVRTEHCTNFEKVRLNPYFICNICKNTFAQKSMFKVHMLNHVTEGKPSEEMYDTHDYTELDDNHTDSQSNEHNCFLCSKVFSNKSSLKRHNNQVHSTLTSKREQNPKRVTKGLKRQDKMLESQDHSSSHKDITFKCEKCSKEFLSRLYYRRHLKNQYCIKAKLRKMNRERSICDICKKSFGSKSTVKQHIRFEHQNGKQFDCKWCHRQFPNPSTYKSHIVKHTRERNFTCKICNGKFVTKEALTYHNRLHTGETPFKCDYCDMSFISASRRMAHIRRKHMDPMFECNICGRKFIFKTILDSHEKKHSNPQSKLFVPNE